MTKQVLFVQGGGDGVHDAWDDKLVASLGTALGPDYAIRYPRMPNEADPRYAPWKVALEQELGTLAPDAIVVGHSIGATILVHVLAEGQPERALAGLFLIATPFIGEGGWPSQEIEPRPDLGARLPPGMPIFLYHGSEDETAPLAHVELYAKAIPQAHVRRLKGRDHQLNTDLAIVADDIRQLGRAAGNASGTVACGLE